MDNIKLGKFIALLRKEKDMTQQDLANLLGVTNKAVSKWECGEGYPEITIVPALAEIFEITTDELLKGERTNEPKEIESEIKSNLLIDNENNKFKNMSILSIGMALLGFLGILIFMNKLEVGLCLVSVFTVASIVVFIISYNNYSNACFWHQEIYKDKEGYNKKIVEKRDKLVKMMWLWIFSGNITLATLVSISYGGIGFEFGFLFVLSMFSLIVFTPLILLFIIRYNKKNGIENELKQQYIYEEDEKKVIKNNNKRSIIFLLTVMICILLGSYLNREIFGVIIFTLLLGYVSYTFIKIFEVSKLIIKKQLLIYFTRNLLTIVLIALTLNNILYPINYFIGILYIVLAVCVFLFGTLFVRKMNCIR